VSEVVEKPATSKEMMFVGQQFAKVDRNIFAHRLGYENTVIPVGKQASSAVRLA